MANTTETDLHKSTTSGHKRKNSASDTGTGRAIKHRSSQACQSCRTRKVRCDVVTNGSPCTNCRLDHMECVVMASRRGKTNRTNGNIPAQRAKSSHPQSARPLNDSSSARKQADIWPAYENVCTPTTPTCAGHVPVVVTFDEDADRQRNDQQFTNNDVTGDGLDGAPSEAYDSLLTPETVTNTLNQHQSPARKISLPAFSTQFSTRITHEDLDFLVQKGATTVPEYDLRIEILRAYLFSVHPFMPMLDFRAFIHAALDNREDSRVSFLLFQAVMFAGLHSLELRMIYRFGFKSVKQARKVFFDRVRLLYEFDVETDNAAVLQSLVLMSLWYGKSDDRRHTWHWTGLAYDVARSMGLHREPTKRHVSDKIRHFRRRLWWSLYIRDRMIALGTRRPMRIRDEDFNVEMLSLEDFDTEPLEESNQWKSLISSAEENNSTALMCIQLAKLCICIGRVVSSQYTVLNSQPDVPPTMMVVSRRNGSHVEELQSCDRELDEWFQALGSNVRRTASSATQTDPQSCSEVHWAILNLTYLTVVNVLHRAQALQPLPNTPDTQAVQQLSRSKVKEAARGLTKTSQTMLYHDQVRFLGPLGVTALVAACLSHMLDISSGDADVRDASTFRLYQSLEVLQSLRGIYASADASVSFLTSITRKAGISIPAQFAAPATDSVASATETHVSPSMGDTNSASLNNQRLAILNEQRDPLNAGRRINPSQILTQSPDSHLQPRTLLEENDKIINGSGIVRPSANAITIGPSIDGYSTSRTVSMSGNGAANISKGPLGIDHRAAQHIDTIFGGPSNPTADGVSLDWNNGMDAGVDFESMAFSYDFYSNAFGFFDGNIQGV